MEAWKPVELRVNEVHFVFENVKEYADHGESKRRVVETGPV